MREVILWPIRVWLVALTLVFSIALSLGVALSNQTLLLLIFSLVILTSISAYRSRLVISVEDSTLRAGRAKIGREYIKEVLLLDDSAMKHERGPGINPRAYLAIRFWIKTGIKVVLDDPRDPTPYWLVSTRRGEAIKKFLNK